MDGRAEGSDAIVDIGARMSIRIAGPRELRLSLPNRRRL